MRTTTRIGQRSFYSIFSTDSGAEEFYLTISSRNGISFQDSITELSVIYNDLLTENCLDWNSLQFVRFYLSDITNDYPKLAASDLFNSMKHAAISLIGQTPVNGGTLGILAYHINGSTFTHRKINPDQTDYRCQTMYSAGKNYSLLWTTNLVDNSVMDSGKQTVAIFDKTDSFLHMHNMCLRNNTIRTWLYMRDVDNNYAGMVKARRERFDTIGLTYKTRFIASTGIEGESVDPSCLVTMDALSIGNITENQISRMEAPTNMSSTHHYGVTFDRGTRLIFGDRSHLYISGTASIDTEGKILFEGDVCNQLHRTIDNVEALLASENAVLTDMCYMILYMRDSKHYPLVEDIISSRIPETIPLIIVEGPVCRPGWLVEIEGVGIIPDKNEFPAFE
jgi:enamine deaminase RidA (YjgF/YER057c/UK114 family)